MVPPKDMQVMYISWQMVGVMAGLLSLILTVITRVLQLSISSSIANSISAMTASLEAKIEAKFSSKESVEGELRLLNLRMQHIEAQLVDLKAQATRNHP